MKTIVKAKSQLSVANSRIIRNGVDGKKNNINVASGRKDVLDLDERQRQKKTNNIIWSLKYSKIVHKKHLPSLNHSNTWATEQRIKHETEEKGGHKEGLTYQS